MRSITRFLCLCLVLMLAVGTFQPASAQFGLGKKLKKAAEKQAGKVIDKSADAAGDKAADEAADAAAKKVDEAFNEDGEDQDGSDASASGSGMANLGNALGAAMVGGGGGVETVDFRELKALLPERAANLARTDARGEKGAAFGISTSQATGSYSSDDGNASVEVQIMDTGSMRGWAMMGYAWAGTEIDSETETGYERTVKYKGYPAYEQYDSQDGYTSSQFSILVGERFLVAVNGNGVSMDDVRATADQINLAKLDEMKEFGLSAVEPVDFQVLKALLPGSIAGLDQTNAAGQKSNAMGFYSSYAEAQYGSGDASIQLTITDLGSMQGIGALGYTWMSATIETETETGWEKTSKYNGFPAHQQYDTSGGTSSAQMDVIVNQRFVVSAQGSGVSMEQVQAAIDAVDISQLKAPESK